MFSTELPPPQVQESPAATFPQPSPNVSRKSERETLTLVVAAALELGWVRSRPASKALLAIANGRFSFNRLRILCCSGAFDAAKRRDQFERLLKAAGV